MFKMCINTGGIFSESIILDDKGSFPEFQLPVTLRDFPADLFSLLEASFCDYILFIRQFLLNQEF
jgi:hypothetical protein